MTKSIPIEGEPEFTLLARDRSAPDMVKQWAFERERQVKTGGAPESDMAKVEGARMVATQMVAWRGSNDGAWRKPQIAKELSVNDQQMLETLDKLRYAITTGQFYDRTVRILGVDIGVTFRDMDNARIFEISRCIGEFAVPKDAVLTDKTEGMSSRTSYGLPPEMPEMPAGARFVTLTPEQREKIAKIIGLGEEGGELT